MNGPNYTTGTITQSGTTVTGSGTNWTDDYIGSTITYLDASTATIIGVNSTTSLTVSVSKTIASSQTYTISTNRHFYSTARSQPQVAIYSRMIDTDTDVFPTKWLMNGIDNSIGARWRMDYRSAVGGSYIVDDISFDNGSNGTPLSASNTRFSQCYVIGNGTLNFSNLQYVSAGLSGRFATTSGAGSTSTCDVDYPATGTRYERYYLRFDSSMPADFSLMSFWDSGTLLSDIRLTSTGTLRLRDNYNTEATTAALAADTWHRIETGIANDQLTVRTYEGSNLHGATPTQTFTITLDGTPNNEYESTLIGLTSNVNANWGLYIDDYRTSSSNWVGSSHPSWGQNTNFGDVTLGQPETFVPKDILGNNTNYARYYYFNVSIDASKTFGYPEDVNRGPTISDLSLFYTADPSKRLRHGKTFTGGEQQPLDTPF
jgi:hypothetical protein